MLGPTQGGQPCAAEPRCDRTHRETPAASACATTWTAVPAADVQGLNGGGRFLEDIAAAAPEDVWAVGERAIPDSRLLIEHWDGRGWGVVPGPDVPGGTLTGIAVVSPDDIWAVGTRVDGVAWTLVERWDGGRWSVVPSPNVDGGKRDNVLTAVAAVSASDVWAVGWRKLDTGGQITRTLVEHWDGHAWSVVPSPKVTTHENNLNSVAAISAEDVWAVGESWTGTEWHTLTMHWDGSAWQTVPSPDTGPPFNGLSDVAALSPNDVWAVGASSDLAFESPKPLVLHWDGSRWDVVPVPAPAPYGLDAIAAAAPDDVWAVDKAQPRAYALPFRRRAVEAPRPGHRTGARDPAIGACPSSLRRGLGGRIRRSGRFRRPADREPLPGREMKRGHGEEPAGVAEVGSQGIDGR